MAVLSKAADKCRWRVSQHVQELLGGPAAADSLVAPGIGDSVDLGRDLPGWQASLCRRALAGLNFACHPQCIVDSVATQNATLHANASARW